MKKHHIKYGSQSPNWRGGKIKRACLYCGKDFFVDSNVIKRGYGIFCSKSCTGHRKYGRKKLAPKKELYCIICNKKFYEYISRLLKEKNRGKCCSRECRILYTQRMISGSRNYRWQGGITPINTLERSQMKTRSWSFSIKKRDSFTCQGCGDKNYKGRGKSIRFHAHHIKAWKDYPGLRFNLTNGITVCYNCHKKIHSIT